MGKTLMCGCDPERTGGPENHADDCPRWGDVVRSNGDFSFGSKVWPGIGKLGEETGELQQVMGKLIATGGAAEHWDGSNLHRRLEDEIADVLAAAEFVIRTNRLDLNAIKERKRKKLTRFYGWHRGQS